MCKLCTYKTGRALNVLIVLSVYRCDSINVSDFIFLFLSLSFFFFFGYRHQFYLHSRLELVEGRLKVSDWTSVARLIALIAQADAGDYDALSPPHALYSQCCQIQPTEPCEPKPQDFLHRIVQQHKEIKVRSLLLFSPLFSFKFMFFKIYIYSGHETINRRVLVAKRDLESRHFRAGNVSQ